DVVLQSVGDRDVDVLREGPVAVDVEREEGVVRLDALEEPAPGLASAGPVTGARQVAGAAEGVVLVDGVVPHAIAVDVEVPVALAIDADERASRAGPVARHGHVAGAAERGLRVRRVVDAVAVIVEGPDAVAEDAD